MRRGISWNLASAVVMNGTRILVIAVLGRALTSADFGIVAAALSVNAIFYSIRDVGIGPALVQRKSLEPRHLETAFAVSTYLGFGLAAFLALIAPVVGDMYRIPESVDVMRALAMLFLLRGISATSRMVAQREMRFALIAKIDTLSFFFGSFTSMGLAVAGLGPWALVLGYLVEDLIATLWYMLSQRTTMTLKVEGGAFKDLLGFGAGQTISQVTGILATYGDNFVVGNVLGKAALGYYTRAYDLIRFPSTVFAAVVGNVLFPAFSKLQDDREQLAHNFRRVMFVNALILLPASGLLFVLAPEAIRILMGAGWEGAIMPFRILTISMLLRTSQKLGGLVAQAAGRVNAVAIAYTVYMVFVIAGAAIAVHWDIIGVATSTTIAIAVVSFECLYLGMQVSGLSLAATVGSHVPGLVVTGIVIAVAWPLAEVMRAQHLATPVIFIGVAIAAGAISLVAIGFALKRGRGDFAWLRDELARLLRRKRRRA